MHVAFYFCGTVKYGADAASHRPHCSWLSSRHGRTPWWSPTRRPAWKSIPCDPLFTARVRLRHTLQANSSGTNLKPRSERPPPPALACISMHYWLFALSPGTQAHWIQRIGVTSEYACLFAHRTHLSPCTEGCDRHAPLLLPSLTPLTLQQPLHWRAREGAACP